MGDSNRTQHSGNNKSPVARWLREPLLHFAVLAGLLFVIDYWASERQRDEIVVSQQTIDYLIKQREDLELRQLAAEERQDTIDQFIEDEILYAEAYKRGLDRGDSRMRRNLILKMRGLLAGEISEPTSAQLRTWYEQNPDRFTIPETWSVEQVFFSDPESVPEALLEQLNTGLAPTTVGETRLDVPRRLREVSQGQLVGILGPDGTKRLLGTEAGAWVGPIDSTLGVHFVRVTGYRQAFRQPYEIVARYLGGEWMLEQTRRRVEQEVEMLRTNYKIVVAGTKQ